jgi:hypothetical protein
MLLSACTKPGDDYGFSISGVEISPGYQKITTRYQQELSLSREAVNALENGVALTVQLELELRDSMTLTLLSDEIRRYEIRFLPLHQRYQLTGPGDSGSRTFPRLRHVLAELADLRFDFRTGPLAPGRYEFRARTRLDNAGLPAPMHLPALFSPDWKHDSEWSTWPFEINA